MIYRISIGPRTLLNDCNHSATAIFWRSAILMEIVLPPTPRKDHILLREDSQKKREAAKKSSTIRLYDGQDTT